MYDDSMAGHGENDGTDIIELLQLYRKATALAKEIGLHLRHLNHSTATSAISLVNQVKPKNLIFMAETYQHRVDGAVFVQLGSAYVYFAEGKPIALASGDVLYRLAEASNGIIYKRIRAVLLRHKVTNRVHEVSKADLQTLVEAALMNLASNLVDERINGR